MVSLAGKGQLRLNVVGLPDSFFRLVTARPLLVLAPTLVLASCLRLLEFTRPFYGHHDFHAAFYALGGAGRRLEEYTNWPPLTDFLYRVSLFLFGQDEWSVRVIPVALSLGTIVLIYLLAKDLFGVETGLLAALFLAIMPADIYFARIATYHFFIPLTIWSYYRWVLTRRGSYLGLAVASNLVGLGFNYSAILLAGLPDLFLAVKHRDWRGQGALVASTVLALAAWFGYLWASDSLAGPQSAATSDNPLKWFSGADLGYWLDNASLFTRQLFTPVLLILSVLWFLLLPLKRNTGDVIVLLWGLAAFGWLLLAPQHSATHDMWWLILAAPVALAAARGLLNVTVPGPARWVPVLLVLAVTGWSSIGGVSQLLRIEYFNSVALGYGIRPYLEEEDVVVGDVPTEIWYSGAKGYIWSYFENVVGEEGFRKVLAEDKPALVMPANRHLPYYQFRDTWEAGYIPLLTSGDRVVYFRKDRAQAAAAGDAALAATVNAVRALPDGSLVRGSDGSPSVYFLKWGLKLAAPDSATLELLRTSDNGVVDDDVVVVDSRALDAVLQGSIIPFLRDGTLIKGPGPEVYVLSGGERRLIPDPSTFSALGYSEKEIVHILDGLLDRIPLGAPIQSQ